MPHYLITTRRAMRGQAISALAAVQAEPDVTVLNGDDPEMVTVEATESAAARLGARLATTHFVEPEIRHSAH